MKCGKCSKLIKKICSNCLSSCKGFNVRSRGEWLFLKSVANIFSVWFFSLTQYNWIKRFHAEMLGGWFQSLLVLNVYLIKPIKFWATSGYFIHILRSCCDPQLWILHNSNYVLDYHMSIFLITYAGFHSLNFVKCFFFFI